MISLTRIFVVAVCSLAACTPQDRVDPPQSPSPIVYGQMRQVSGDVTPLSDITASPERYEGKEVLTEGQIERVCQKRGCWLELADSTGARAFVPMAGHAFAVPMDSVGERALVEGTVRRRERSEEERQHLESDGAGSHIPSLSIVANGVVIP